MSCFILFNHHSFANFACVHTIEAHLRALIFVFNNGSVVIFSTGICDFMIPVAILVFAFHFDFKPISKQLIKLFKSYDLSLWLIYTQWLVAARTLSFMNFVINHAVRTKNSDTRVIAAEHWNIGHVFALAASISAAK